MKLFDLGTGVIVVKSYGQYDQKSSRRELIGGCDILCACPGRLKHILYSDWVRLYNSFSIFNRVLSLDKLFLFAIFCSG